MPLLVQWLLLHSHLEQLMGHFTVFLQFAKGNPLSEQVIIKSPADQGLLIMLKPSDTGPECIGTSSSHGVDVALLLKGHLHMPPSYFCTQKETLTTTCGKSESTPPPRSQPKSMLFYQASKLHIRTRIDAAPSQLSPQTVPGTQPSPHPEANHRSRFRLQIICKGDSASIPLAQPQSNQSSISEASFACDDS